MISAPAKTRSQVFLSFARSDHRLAETVADTLRQAGLQVVRMDDLRTGGQYNDAVRKALNKSDAVVVALSSVSKRHDLPASVLFEIGAAVGAKKPIYVVVEDATATFPFTAPDMEILPLNRLDEIADKLAIR